MDRTSFGEQFVGDLCVMAAMWGPATAGLLLMGPWGILVGVAGTAALWMNDDSSPPQGSDQG